MTERKTKSPKNDDQTERSEAERKFFDIPTVPGTTNATTVGAALVVAPRRISHQT